MYNRFEFPSKFLVNYYYQLDPRDDEVFYGCRLRQIAHMYIFDSYVTKDDLSLIHTCYNTNTRERVRQILSKYMRTVIKALKNG